MKATTLETNTYSPTGNVKRAIRRRIANGPTLIEKWVGSHNPKVGGSNPPPQPMQSPPKCRGFRLFYCGRLSGSFRIVLRALPIRSRLNAKCLLVPTT